MRRPLVSVLAATLLMSIVACGTDDSADDRREAVVYATIIRALVSSAPDIEPDDLLDTDIFVWGGEGHSIPLEVQARTVDELDSYSSIRFVDDRKEAIDSDEPDEPIRNEGVLITLGPVSPTGSVVTVQAAIETNDGDDVFDVRLRRDAAGWMISAPPALVS